MAELDPRIIRVGFEIDGQLKTYEGLNIACSGTKYANANQNDCEFKISNLDKATRDYLLSETSPFNKNPTPKRIFLDVGRQSYGTFRLFEGNITAATPSQPPDITLTIKALTANYAKGDVVARSQSAQVPLSRIAQQVAADLGMALDFQATDKTIANYSFTGAKLKQVDALGLAGDVSAYVDNTTLVVKDRSVPLVGRQRILNIDTGMIGIPETTEQGLKVKFLLDNTTALGGSLRVQSIVYPALSGDYVVYKLGFEVASRDTPFYYIAEATRQ